MTNTIPHPRRNFQDIILGKPIETASAHQHAIGMFIGLAVLASDALSSVGYATQEMLHILAAAAAHPNVNAQIAFGYSVPLSAAILCLLVVLTISYRQTIFAYPDGGGSYRVSKENLGEVPAQIAGAALSLDYILTVAVSVSSGVEQIASAFPAVHPYRVIIAVTFIVFMTWMNLRGVKESGVVFAIPTYFFVGTTFITIGIAAFRYFTGNLPTVHDVEMYHSTVTQPITLWLLLRAFSSGCTALTGVEAISNGVGVFKQPTSKNAANTMLMMTSLIIVMFGGITLLANAMQAVPSETETVVSQIARTVYGGRTSPFYLAQMAGMTLILLMAANTAYADFPRLAALHATDGFLPRQLATKGHRLVFSWGVVVLAIAASVLIIIFDAKVTLLIPLYAIGVFLSFFLSDAGMAVHWWRTRVLKPGETEKLEFTTLHHDKGWWWKMFVNAFGSFMSFCVMIIFAVTKFASGAWIILILVPIMVTIFFRIHHHYKNTANRLSLAGKDRVIAPRKVYTIVLIDDLHAAAIRAINFSMSLGYDWEPIHISLNDARTKTLESKWQKRQSELQGKKLIILPSPYRSLTEPIREYISKLRKADPDAYIHIVLGALKAESWYGQLLHRNSESIFRQALGDIEGIGFTTIAFHLSQENEVTQNTEQDNKH